MQNHPAILFARTMLPLFKNGPMYSACMSLACGVTINITPPHKAAPLNPDGTQFPDHTLEVLLFPWTSELKEDDPGFVYEACARFDIECTANDAEELRKGFASLYGGYLVTPTDFLGEVDIGEQIHFKDCPYIASSTRFSFEQGADEDVIITVWYQIPGNPDPSAMHYRVNKVNPLLSVVRA